VKYEMLKAKNYKGDRPIQWIERKLDGHRIVIEKRDSIFVRTRTVGVDLWPDIQRIEHLAQPILQMATGTILDCELWEEGSYSTDMKTRIKEGSSKLRITPFAMPFFQDKSATDRISNPDSMFDMFEMMGFHRNWYCLLDGRFDYDYWRNRATEMGWEGFVAKEGHLSGWWKVKPVRTAEVIVTGINRSTSATYYGDIKSLRGSVFDGPRLVEVGNIGGLTAEQRSKPEDHYLHQVMEVEFDSLAGQGRLRFPRFKRLRMDKHPSECTMEQLQ